MELNKKGKPNRRKLRQVRIDPDVYADIEALAAIHKISAESLVIQAVTLQFGNEISDIHKMQAAATSK